MKTPQEYVNEFFGEIQFVSCPTETKEPFFWKWTNDGKEIIESYLLTSLEEYGKQCEEKGRGETLNKIKKLVLLCEEMYGRGGCGAIYDTLHEGIDKLESARQSDNK